MTFGSSNPNPLASQGLREAGESTELARLAVTKRLFGGLAGGHILNRNSGGASVEGFGLGKGFR